MEKLGSEKLNGLFKVIYAMALPPKCFLPTNLEASKIELMGQAQYATWFMEHF